MSLHIFAIVHFSLFVKLPEIVTYCCTVFVLMAPNLIHHKYLGVGGDCRCWGQSEHVL